MKTLYLSSIALAALTAGCAAPASQVAANAPPTPVSVARAEMADLRSTFEGGGVVRARSTAAIGSRVMAPILEVHVRPGDRVRRGAPLLTLDARELGANQARAKALLTGAAEATLAAESDVRAAESAVVLARATRDRMSTLHEKRSATAQELDQAVAALDAANAQLAAARARATGAADAHDAAQAAVEAATIAASYAVLTAPFDGIVTERSADPGSMANPGATLLALDDASAFRLEVALDEGRASAAAVGQSVDVLVGDTAESADGWIPARISEVARLDPAAHSFLVKIDLPGSVNVRSGLFGRARFSGPSRRALTVPGISDCAARSADVCLHHRRRQPRQAPARLARRDGRRSSGNPCGAFRWPARRQAAAHLVV